MIGAIIGDIIGSRFEFDNIKTKDFDLFTDESTFTDDTVMTLAVAQALMNCGHDMTRLSDETVKCMRELGQKYPDRGYGGRFGKWLVSRDPQPYNSYGNGAAMRVSPCGDAAQSLQEAVLLSEDVTKVTHNHEEGLKGAECTAVAVYLSRSGMSKDEMRTYLSENYYPMDFTLDEIRPDYTFDESCQGTVPQSLVAFFEAESFEDAIRNAISIGGDSDTLADITGGIAGNYFSIPDRMKEKAFSYLPAEFIEIIDKFQEYIKARYAEVY